MQLLVNSQGQPFDTNSWGKWWMALQLRHGAPLPHLSWHQLRHMFCTDRQANPGIPGPSPEGAAMLMNNTPKQWRASYTPNVRVATAAAAAAAAPLYRQHHLNLAAASRQQARPATSRRGVVISDSE